MELKKKCGAACCSTKSYWPPKAFTEENRGNGAKDRWVKNGIGLKNELYSCGYLGPGGCTLTSFDKPITCLLHPLKLNENNKIVSSNWITLKKGVCKGNHGQEPMLFTALKDNLCLLFGTVQYNRVFVDVTRGKDSYFYVSQALKRQYDIEKRLEEKDEKPRPRSTY